MDRGTYVSASAGLNQLRKLDVVSNNLANVNTPGFKRQLIVTDTQSFDETLASEVAAQDPYAEGDHQRSPGAVNIRSVTDFSQGPIKNTGNPLDVAITRDNEFFVVNTTEGLQYTRAGNFTLREDGTLVTQDGHEVQGDGGAIQIADGTADITSGGVVRVNGQQVGSLQVVRFEDTKGLERVAGSRFRLQGGGSAAPEPVEAELVPKALEMSNVTTVSSIIEMIAANRGFQLYTKSARTIDDMNNVAITQVGRQR